MSVQLRPGPPHSSASPTEQPVDLAWRVHLAAEEPGKAVVVVLAIFLAGALAHFLWRGPLPVIGATFVLLNAVAEFLFPIEYRLSPTGAEMCCFLTRRAIPWPAVQRAYRLPDGVKLSPLPHPSRREPFRGIFLRFAANETQVLAWIQQARTAE